MTSRSGWPRTAAELADAQARVAATRPVPWLPPDRPLAIGAVWFVAPTGSPGDRGGEPAWAAAVLGGDEEVVRGETGAGYVAGSLALREGPLLETALRRLPALPDVLLVNATGRDHPRGAGLALHLGAILDVPTIGVTDRPLLAIGAPPTGPDDTAPLTCDGLVVAAWLRTRPALRPLVVHAAWRTDVEIALAVVRSCVGRARTPEPLRAARRAARLARARDEGRLGTG